MGNIDFHSLEKAAVVQSIVDHKLEVIEDFKQDEKTRLAQVGGDDMDNRHIDSKNEETMAEMEFLTHNIEILEREILLLKNVVTEAKSDKVNFGSLVHTDMGVLLVASAQEKLNVDGCDVIGISTAAPIYKMMEGQRKGARFELNGREHEIIDIK